MKNENRPYPLSYKYLPKNEQVTEPKTKHAHEKVYKSCPPFTGSFLYYIQTIPSITTSLKHEQNAIIKNIQKKDILF